MHVAWSRIDAEKMRAIDPGLYKNKLKEISRELEQELGLTLVKSERAPEDKTRASARNEFEQARRLNTGLKAIRETIRECWDRSDDGNEPAEKFCGDCGAALADQVQASSGKVAPARPITPEIRITPEPDASTVSDGERKTVTALFADIKARPS